jgi:hypothetical protein
MVQEVQRGWDVNTSRSNYDQLAQQQQMEGMFNPEYSTFAHSAPESISLRLVEAPAEFAVPVKQDRCEHTKQTAR